MRHFLPDPVAPDVLMRLIDAARQAPSVGYMQPWRFVRITDPAVREELHRQVAAEINVTAGEMGQRKAEFMRLKLEGILECAEVWVAALMEGRDNYVLGRRTMPEMDLASLSCAVQNIWLAARAEGLGVGWVSFFDPEVVARTLEMPADSFPAAILCIGHVASFYPEPLLRTEGWDSERAREDILFENRWGMPVQELAED